MYDFNKHLQQSWCTRSSRTSALFFKANGAQVQSAFCAYIFRAKKKVKKSCGLGDVGNWCLLVVGDYECVPIASMLLRYQVFVSIVRGLKIEVFSWLMVACALNIERDASGTAEARLREWLHGSCTAQPDVVALPQEWKLGILLGPGVALSLEEKVTDVLVWVSGTRNLRLPFVITLQGAWNLQGRKFLGSRVYF